MALTGRTEFRNNNFIGSKSKTLSMPGLIAQAYIQTINTCLGLVSEHAVDGAYVNSGAGGFNQYCPAVGGIKAEDNKRYISQWQTSGAYSGTSNYRNEYQYAPTNTQAQISFVYGLNGESVRPTNTDTGYATDSEITNITYNLTVMSIHDWLATSNKNYLAIPLTLSYNTKYKGISVPLTSITKATFDKLYGNYKIVTAVDIIDKNNGTILDTIKYGQSTSYKYKCYESYSSYRNYGYFSKSLNIEYNEWISIKPSTEIRRSYPYDGTLYQPEGLTPFLEYITRFNNGSGLITAWNQTLTSYGYGVICASTESVLLANDIGRSSKNTEGNFIMWADNEKIIQYFVDNVGFGVTINDIDSALDPDNPDPGLKPDDGQPENPEDDDPGDGDNESDPIEYPDPVITPIAGRKFFALTSAQVSELTSFLFNETFLNNVKRLWSEPGEYVIDLSYYPVDLTQTGIDFSAAENISIGGVGSEILAPEILGGRPFIYMGDYTPKAYYNSYLDYAPYTRIEIYLPYIGMRPLDVNQIMGHSLHVGYYIDYATQQVMAAIGLDGTPENPLGTPINQYTGNLAVHVPLSGESAQQLLIGTINQGIGAVGNAASIAGGIASSNPGQVVKGATGFIGNLIPEQVNRREYGNITAMTGIYSPQQVFLLIDRPIAAEPTGFKDKLGYSASYGGKVSEFSGYLQCNQAQITQTGTMTKEECEEIVALLKGGIYI